MFFYSSYAQRSCNPFTDSFFLNAHLREYDETKVADVFKQGATIVELDITEPAHPKLARTLDFAQEPSPRIQRHVSHPSPTRTRNR